MANLISKFVVPLLMAILTEDRALRHERILAPKTISLPFESTEMMRPFASKTVILEQADEAPATRMPRRINTLIHKVTDRLHNLDLKSQPSFCLDRQTRERRMLIDKIIIHFISIVSKL